MRSVDWATYLGPNLARMLDTQTRHLQRRIDRKRSSELLLRSRTLEGGGRLFTLGPDPDHAVDRSWAHVVAEQAACVHEELREAGLLADAPLGDYKPRTPTRVVQPDLEPEPVVIDDFARGVLIDKLHALARKAGISTETEGFLRGGVVVPIEDFFEGNTDDGSICLYVVRPPSLDEIRRLLLAIRDRHDVLDVGILIEEYENDLWPYSDTVVVVTTAHPKDVARWLEPLEPTTVSSGFLRPDPNPPGLIDVPDGHRLCVAWWD